MKRCIAVDDFHGALSHNMAFHFTLYQSAGKHVVLPLIEMLWLQAGPFLALSLTTPGRQLDRTPISHALLAALRRQPRSCGPFVPFETDIADTSMQLFKKAVFEDVPAAVPPAVIC